MATTSSFNSSNVPPQASQPGGTATGVRTDGSTSGVDALGRGILVNQVPADGIHAVRADGFDENKYRDYLADGRAHFSLTSGGAKQETKLTKKAGNDSTERVPDDARHEKLDKALAELKFTLGLTKEHFVNYRINTRLIEVYDKDKKLIGKYNLRDKGTFEPNGPIQGSGGITQLFRDTNNRGDIPENILERVGKLDQKIKEIVEPETGNFKNIYSLDENFGAVNGHQALSVYQSPEAHKLLTDKDGAMNAQNLKELGLVKEAPGASLRTHYTLTGKGKRALKQIRRAKLLQEILSRNLQDAINARQETIKSNSPPQNDAEKAVVETNTKEIKELEKVKKEIDSAKRSDTITHWFTKDETVSVMPGVTLPIFLMNQKFSIQVPKYTDATRTRYKYDENNQIRMKPKQFSLKDFNKSAADMTEQEKTNFKDKFKLKLSSSDAEIEAFREKLVDTAIHQSVHRVRRLIGYDPSRQFPNVFKVGKADWKEGDEQLAADIGGLMHQMLAESYQSSSVQKHIDFTENQIGNRMAHESRGATFLGATVLRDPVPEGAEGTAERRDDQRLCGFRNESELVKGFIRNSLDQYEQTYHEDNALGLKLDKSFTEGELSEFFQESMMVDNLSR